MNHADNRYLSAFSLCKHVTAEDLWWLDSSHKFLLHKLTDTETGSQAMKIS
jgi:hypothetical protein